MSDAALVSLSGDCTIFEIADIRQQLLAALRSDRPVTLDLTPVGKVDASGLQLLIAAHRTGRCDVRGLSEKTVEDCRRIGWEFPGKDAA